MNKSFFILLVLLISITSCTVYVTPDSATISKNRSTIPAAIPTTSAPTTTKKTIITEIQNTPTTQPTKKAFKTLSNTTVRTVPPSPSTSTLYTVKPKDTVFSIMRKTNANWADIIRINNLEPPNYTIYPGQVLRLK